MSEFQKVTLQELPDQYAKSELHAHCQCLAHAWFLREGYRTILQDRKPFVKWDKIATLIEEDIRRAVPKNEAEWLINTARKAGIEAANNATVN